MEITKQTGLRGVVHVPGDKSISHRAVMFGALARGTTSVTHFLEGADCLSTISCFQKMGIEIEKQDDKVLIHGKGLRGLNSPREILDAGNSGTTTRLIAGILAGHRRALRRSHLRALGYPVFRAFGHAHSDPCCHILTRPRRVYGLCAPAFVRLRRPDRRGVVADHLSGQPPPGRVLRL